MSTSRRTSEDEHFDDISDRVDDTIENNQSNNSSTQYLTLTTTNEAGDSLLKPKTSTSSEDLSTPFLKSTQD